MTEDRCQMTEDRRQNTKKRSPDGDLMSVSLRCAPNVIRPEPYPYRLAPYTFYRPPYTLQPKPSALFSNASCRTPCAESRMLSTRYRSFPASKYNSGGMGLLSLNGLNSLQYRRVRIVQKYVKRMR
jgi:hypothetical protein